MKEKPLLRIGMDSRIFRKYYYLRKELVDFCREAGLSVCGNKQELTERIGYFLDTGGKSMPVVVRKAGRVPQKITLESRIEENMVCSEKHRIFFRQAIGASFTFRVIFQRWLRSHAGSTYAEAVSAWYELQKQKQTVEIGGQFEYNTYIRDFFRDNPGKSLQDAITCWNYKKLQPGNRFYTREDLSVLLNLGR